MLHKRIPDKRIPESTDPATLVKKNEQSSKKMKQLVLSNYITKKEKQKSPSITKAKKAGIPLSKQASIMSYGFRKHLNKPTQKWADDINKGFLKFLRWYQRQRGWQRWEDWGCQRL